jgi:ABC transporter with metal-binding/Fe-S-binding domain ATP-binding protein
MRLGVLFSGGKDSTLALHKAVEKEQVVCLITVVSKNPQSYMFHTANVTLTSLQAEAIGLPLVKQTTGGEKEEELKDLEQAIRDAVRSFRIDGVISGAIESVYQASRIQRICHRLDLWCFNPLWKRDQRELLEETLQRRFETLISGVFAYPLDETWLGKQIDQALIERLFTLAERYGISPSGEGGELETTVLDAPLFNKKIQVLDSSVQTKGGSGFLVVKKAKLVQK